MPHSLSILKKFPSKFDDIYVSTCPISASQRPRRSVSVITNRGTTLNAQCPERKSKFILFKLCRPLYSGIILINEKNNGEQFHYLSDYKLLLVTFFSFLLRNYTICNGSLQMLKAENKNSKFWKRPLYSSFNFFKKQLLLHQHFGKRSNTSLFSRPIVRIMSTHCTSEFLTS